jgi:NADH-quinone oxidoreductase subunit C
MNNIQLNHDEQIILDALKDRLPELEVDVEKSCGQLSIGVDKKMIVPVCQLLKEHPAGLFDYLADLCGVDYLGKREKRFQVVYNLYSISRNHRIRVKTDIDEADCTVDSVTGLWETANWHERELYDMFGIEVRGHPDLRRILMPDEWEGHPLRKDYPLQGKGQRDDFSFVPREDREPTREPDVRREEW